jgi:hypothetical protein
MCHSIAAPSAPLRNAPDPWVNIDGDVAPPNSPDGGGGPGYFTVPEPPPDRRFDALPHPLSPAGRTFDPLDVGSAPQAQATPQANPAPRVAKSTTEKLTAKRLTVTVAADSMSNSGIQGAKTDPDWTPSGKINYHANDAAIVTSFENTVAFAVVIQTKYGTGKPNDVSAYGRGTTDSDKQAGNVTLGFHESCHRNDLLTYFRNTPTPQFAGTNGMGSADFETAMEKYNAAWNDYFEKSMQNSRDATDEVGNPTKTAWCNANPGSCTD